jgi:L-cysteate sulfo-lyase
VGMQCELVLTRAVPRYDREYVENGNILLDDLLGARVHDLPGTANALEFAQARADELRRHGRKVYVCPLGGSSPVGCLGYAACAAEILTQAHEQGLEFSRIVVPNGSGGMHAGLAAGFAALGVDPSLVLAYTVLAKAEQAHAATLEKANKTLELIDPALRIEGESIVIEEAQLGDGYGIPTDAMREAVRLMASKEGLLLDPVYGGKAFAGLVQGARSGRHAAGENVLFIMTGGLPGLFAYRSAF